MSAGPLTGLRVVDLSRYIAGPLCAMTLADLGADVVKVESPNGDPSRREGPWIGEESLYFAQMNRNKRGVTIDLRSEDGRAELARLLDDADVLVENFRPGVLDAIGFGRAELERRWPRLVVANVTGYGRASAMGEAPAFDAILQASTGLAMVSGDTDAPQLIGAYVVDVGAALLATIGVLAALRQRDEQERGQEVDVSLLDAALVLLGAAVPVAAATGEAPERVGSFDRTEAPAGPFRAGDGWIYMQAGSDRFFPLLAAAMERPDLAEDPRYRSHAGRIEHRAELEAEVAAWVGGLTVDELTARLAEHPIPLARVRTVDEAVRDPELGIERYLVDVVGATGAVVPTLLTPIRFSAADVTVRHDVPRR